MKKNRIWFLGIFFLVLTVVSCKKDDPTILEISSDVVSVDSIGGIERILVTANTSWSAVADESWISISQSVESGEGELILSFPAMPTSADRNALITVQTTDGVSKEITVSQSPRIKKSGLADMSLYISGVTSASVCCKALIQNDYGNQVTKQGVCWSASERPTIEDNCIETEDSLIVISGLAENTTYYVRSFAINKKGTSYGRQLSFTTKSVSEKEGRIAKGFLISDTMQVYFSQGNLQYHAVNNTWRFAESQQDMIGVDNASISATYDGWIDLFGWATSGYDAAPYTTALNYSLYGYGFGEKNISATIYDWGEYNTIGSSSAGDWRTLTNSEWTYILFNRPNAQNLRGLAQLSGVAGLVLLPDNWELPEGCAFEPTVEAYSTNTYSVSQWSVMEQNGAVFLPAGGNRYGTTIKEGGIAGYYWSSTTAGKYSAYSISFVEGLVAADRSYRIYGRSVRLVQNLY